MLCFSNYGSLYKEIEAARTVKVTRLAVRVLRDGLGSRIPGLLSMLKDWL